MLDHTAEVSLPAGVLFARVHTVVVLEMYTLVVTDYYFSALFPYLAGFILSTVVIILALSLKKHMT